jgi:hypothetical protein
MTKLLSCSLLSLLAAAGCSSESTAIADTMLAGTVFGQPWTFQAGHTSAFLSEGEDEFFASLYPTAFTPCELAGPTGPHLIVSIPKTPGDYELSFALNMTFADGNSNLIATEGRIVVDEVTATTVTGGLVAIYDDANQVNGRFDVTICSPAS